MKNLWVDGRRRVKNIALPVSRLLKAQGMVEFALIIPLLLVLTLGIMEGGRLLFMYTSISAAGREAARYAAGVGQNVSGTNLYNDCDGIRAAAARIGFIAGLNAGNVKIYHDSGPSSTPSYPAPGAQSCPAVNATQYCTGPTDAQTFKLGDRVAVSVDVPYSPLVPLLPIPNFDLKSCNAHTVLLQVPVVAYTPASIPGGQTCDNSAFKIVSETDPTQTSAPNKITIHNTGGAASAISNILVVWDPTSNPKLVSITDPSGAVITVNSPPPMWSSAVSWNFPTSPDPTFTLTFDQKLKNPVIVQLTLTNPSGCTFGR
jgi:hypothetical protein